MSRFETFFSIVSIPLDFLAVVLAFLAAYTLRIHPDLHPYLPEATGFVPSWSEYLPFVFISAAFLLLVLALQGLYQVRYRRRFFQEIPRVVYGVLIWMLLIMAWFFMGRDFFFSRFVLGAGFLLSALFIIFFRAGLRVVRRTALRYGMGARKVLLIGGNVVSSKIYHALSKNRGMRVVSVLVFEQQTAHPTFDQAVVRVVHTLDDIKKVIEQGEVDDVIQADGKLTAEEEAELLEFCHDQHKTFRFIPSLYHLHGTNIDTTTIGDLPVIELKSTALDGWGKILKRAFDILGSLLGLILLSPLFLLLGVSVKLGSEGPAFVKLERVNKGQPFSLYKFRSMIKDADKLKATLLSQNERGDGPLFKMKDDPRITPIGKFLRKSRLDELPQLINVLKGEMSLVGPRPHEPSEVAKYEKHHRKLLAITPGITGMGQVEGASDLDFEEEVRVDRYYIENWSLWLDIEILLRTVWVVLRGKGAA